MSRWVVYGTFIMLDTNFSFDTRIHTQWWSSQARDNPCTSIWFRGVFQRKVHNKVTPGKSAHPQCKVSTVPHSSTASALLRAYLHLLHESTPREALGMPGYFAQLLFSYDLFSIKYNTARKKQKSCIDFLLCDPGGSVHLPERGPET